MIIELQWAWTPEEPERNLPCVCGVWVSTAAVNGGVVIRAATDEGTEMGGACEEYRRIVPEHPRPMFSSYEDMKAAAPAYEDPADTFYDASWLWKSTAVRASAR